MTLTPEQRIILKTNIEANTDQIIVNALIFEGNITHTDASQIFING